MMRGLARHRSASLGEPYGEGGDWQGGGSASCSDRRRFDGFVSRRRADCPKAATARASSTAQPESPDLHLEFQAKKHSDFQDTTSRCLL